MANAEIPLQTIIDYIDVLRQCHGPLSDRIVQIADQMKTGMVSTQEAGDRCLGLIKNAIDCGLYSHAATPSPSLNPSMNRRSGERRRSDTLLLAIQKCLRKRPGSLPLNHLPPPELPAVPLHDQRPLPGIAPVPDIPAQPILKISPIETPPKSTVTGKMILEAWQMIREAEINQLKYLKTQDLNGQLIVTFDPKLAAIFTVFDHIDSEEPEA